MYFKLQTPNKKIQTEASRNKLKMQNFGFLTICTNVKQTNCFLSKIILKLHLTLSIFNCNSWFPSKRDHSYFQGH